MCGICGIFNYSANQAPPVVQGVIEKMCGRIAHRGPDDSGVHVEGPVGLGNRRLSIIDLTKGHQPIYNEDGNVVIVYNGEVYNFKEIRQDLVKRGHVFATDTDTEMIVHAYEEYGVDCVHRFNGMLSFAIWDGKKKRLFIARDRLGIKPLFYTVKNGSLTFGSEIKCVLENGEVNRGINFQALDHYFSLGYIPCPHTIFKGIWKLPPGHWLVCDQSGVAIHRYWDVDFEEGNGRREEDLCEEFIDLLRSSVKYRLISDVPLGAFLSGGIDSSLIVALMSEVSSLPPRTFSIGFDDALYDESPFSEMLARKYGTVHHNFVVKADIEDVLGQIVEAFDEPFADDGAIPCFHVCRETRREVKVALSGLGGDELFGGYHRYLGFQMSQAARNLPLSKIGLWNRLVQLLPESKGGGYTVDRIKRFVEALPLSPAERYINYLFFMNGSRRKGFFNGDVYRLMDTRGNFEELSSIYERPRTNDEINKAYYLDFMTYLPEDVLALTDRMSMWHSLEVRVPFLDHRLVEFSAKLNPKIKIKNLAMKYFLKKAARAYLPEVILKKRKQGFVGPMPLWLMRDLRDYTLEVLSGENLKRHGLFNQEAVNKILYEHMNLKRKHETLIWAMLVFDRWYREYMG
jgi:asparagine synthase (glutamine-hydrolysing)